MADQQPGHPRKVRTSVKGPLMFSAFWAVVAFLAVVIFASGGSARAPRFDLAFTAAGIAFIVTLVIAAMLSIADARFQPELMRRAKEAGKLPKNFQIPAYARENTPRRIARALKPFRERGLLPPFPFGTDFDIVEQRLVPALQALKDAAEGQPLRLLALLLGGLVGKGDTAALARLALDQPKNFADRLYGILVSGALRRTRS